MLENLIVQFPDLGEMEYSKNTYHSCSTELKDVQALGTEFVFHLAAMHESQHALDMGFKLVSCMNNWYAAHWGQARCMNLYWYKNPSPTFPTVTKRVTWAYDRDGTSNYKVTWDRLQNGEYAYKNFLAASGCGFAIGERPLIPEALHRFFNVVRMPLQVSFFDKKLLKQMNYRLLDIGKRNSYWVNGWKPEEYSYVKECEYFNVDSSWQNLEEKV